MVSACCQPPHPQEELAALVVFRLKRARIDLLASREDAEPDLVSPGVLRAGVSPGVLPRRVVLFVVIDKSSVVPDFGCV